MIYIMNGGIMENKIICPVCKELVLDINKVDKGEDGFNPCNHVMLVYTDALSFEFIHIDESMESVAKDMIEKSAEDDVFLNELMNDFAMKHDNYEIIELTTSGMSCGPCGNTDYVMFKIG